MKKLFIWCLVGGAFIFSISASAQPDTGKIKPCPLGRQTGHEASFVVYNREFEHIDGAVFMLNGKQITKCTYYDYYIDSLPGPPYHVTIEYPGYLKYEGNSLAGEYYLLREGEDYFYQQNVKRPIISRRDLLFVAFHQYDNNGSRIDPQLAKQKLQNVLETRGMKIFYSYGDTLKNQYNLKKLYKLDGMGTGGEQYQYLVAKTDGSEFGEDDDDIAYLRNNLQTTLTGPALLRYDNFNSAWGYEHYIQAIFATDKKTALAELTKAGYTQITVSNSYGFVYRIELPASTGMSMNRHVENLLGLPGIISADPDIIAFESR